MESKDTQYKDYAIIYEEPPSDDDKLAQLQWLHSKKYLNDQLYKNSIRYYEKENNVEKFEKVFETWEYDEIIQKTIVNEKYFDDLKTKQSQKIISIFGELHSGREYTIKHLYNSGRKLDRKISYINGSINKIVFKLIDFSDHKQGVMIKAFHLNDFFVDDSAMINKLKYTRFINQFIADISNVIIYINSDEDDEEDNKVKQFISKYNIALINKTMIIIKNGFKNNNSPNDKKIIEEEEKNNKYRIYYENEDANISTFKRIFDKLKRLQKGTNKDISIRYKEFYGSSKEFLEGDYIKCEYHELLNSNLTYTLTQANNTIVITLICYEQITNVTHSSIIWNKCLYLIITVESVTKAKTNLYLLIHDSLKTKLTFNQDSETGLLTITLS